jgi:hypothetical protein
MGNVTGRLPRRHPPLAIIDFSGGKAYTSLEPVAFTRRVARHELTRQRVRWEGLGGGTSKPTEVERSRDEARNAHNLGDGMQRRFRRHGASPTCVNTYLYKHLPVLHSTLVSSDAARHHFRPKICTTFWPKPEIMGAGESEGCEPPRPQPLASGGQRYRSCGLRCQILPLPVSSYRFKFQSNLVWDSIKSITTFAFNFKQIYLPIKSV